MKIVAFSSLPANDQEYLNEAAKNLNRSLNKVTNPSTCAIAVTESSHYFGNNIFLSTIKIISATSKLDEAMLTDSEELLPEGFKSAGLGRMVGES